MILEIKSYFICCKMLIWAESDIMRTRLIVAGLMALFSINLFYTGAQVPLCPFDCTQMKPEAREHYEKALEYIDRIYLEGAMEEIRIACEKNPEHVNLHFFLADLARQLGRLYTTPNPIPNPPPDPMSFNAPPPPYFYEFQDPLKYYTIAESALLHIQKFETLTKEQETRLSSMLPNVQKEKGELAQRDKIRKEVGLKIIKDFLQETGAWKETLTPAETPAPDAAPAIAAPAISIGGSPFVSGAGVPFTPPSVATSETEGSSPFSTSAGAPAVPATTETQEAPAAPTEGVSPFSTEPAASEVPPIAPTGEAVPAPPDAAPAAAAPATQPAAPAAPPEEAVSENPFDLN